MLCSLVPNHFNNIKFQIAVGPIMYIFIKLLFCLFNFIMSSNRYYCLLTGFSQIILGLHFFQEIHERLGKPCESYKLSRLLSVFWFSLIKFRNGCVLECYAIS